MNTSHTTNRAIQPSSGMRSQPHLFKNTRTHLADKLVPAFLFLCAFISVATMAGIMITLFTESIAFFRQIPLTDFLFGKKWAPLFEPKEFGVLPLLAGTFLITIIALVIAIPIGLASAVYLSEYAPDRVRRIVKPVLEVLAGIPTIVYGFFALTFISPIVQALSDDAIIFNALSAGIAVGIMIIPMICSLSEDAMNAVPRSLRDAAFALGSTRWEVSRKIVMPAAFSGIIASIVLAFSRVIGETMIVTVAAGATPKLTLNPLESIQTMTAYIVQVSFGDAEHGSLETGSIYAVGITLFFITLLLSIAANYIAKRFREEY